MKVVKIELYITDILLIKTGLDHVINNTNYHECDREVAKQLYKYIDEETTKQVGIIERGD
jgi:hypothetical protein